MKLLRQAARTALIALCAWMAPGAAHAETIIKYSSYVPATHPISKDAILPWAEEVARVTDGRVKFEHMVKMAGTAPSQYDVVRDGLADMALVTPGYTPGRFDLTNIGEMPLLSDDPLVASVAFYRFYEKYLAPLDIFKDVHVVTVTLASPGVIFTKRPPIKQISDLKGLKLRSPLTTTVPVITALGAIPVQKPATELYELLSTGVIDGSLSGAEQAVTWNLADAAKAITIVPGGLYNSVLVFVMNKDKWNSISEADRAAITAISGEKLAKRVGEIYRKPVAEGLQRMRDAGGTVETASPELTAAIAAALKPVEASVLDMARSKGLKDPEAALADYRAMIATLQKEYHAD
ncbi:TRAP-type C4-dicarboxylate transport system substrate-binding protein [Rhodoligotrophos appendicifer]|uniref:TRAP transporter substrate-binding protein n=1 Tax=Rhodoligotrophos appendicifer TaxID=987056 RepID=UPI0011809214|nr:TRAP transporter substrate-binding protein [Rhodoligotrophos appendicifer]